MKYTEIEDLDTFTLREAVATYGEEILPLWKKRFIQSHIN